MIIKNDIFNGNVLKAKPVNNSFFSEEKLFLK